MKYTLTILAVLLSAQLFAQAPKQAWDLCFSDTAKGYATENDMATDVYGNTYITGYFQKQGDYVSKYFFLLKNDAYGVQQWLRFFPKDTSAFSKYNLGNAVTVDVAGNIYVTGSTYDTICNVCTVEIPHEDLFTLKYNSQGKLVWMNKYNGNDSTYQTAKDLKTDDTGNIYIVGNEAKYNPKNFTYSNSILTQKIRANGTTLWVKKLPRSVGHGIALDHENNILIAAVYDPENTYQLQHPEIVKYNSNGDTIWTRTFIEPAKNGKNYFIECDNAGNIYANGETDTLAFNNIPRIITFKYSPDGNLLWYKKDSTYTHTFPHIFGDFKIDSKGNAYVAGYITDGSFQTRKWIVTKYSSKGKQLWNNVYGGPNFSSSAPIGLEIDDNQNVFVSGSSYASTSRSFEAYTLIGYNAAGIQQWVVTYPKKLFGNAYPVSMGIDAVNNIYVSGGVGRYINGGSSTEQTICTVKYTSILSSIENVTIAQNAKNNSFNIFPNPCANNLFVQNKMLSGIFSYAVYNAAGKIILQNNSVSFSKGDTKVINVSQLSAGLYLLNIKDNKNNFVQKFLKQ